MDNQCHFKNNMDNIEFCPGLKLLDICIYTYVYIHINTHTYIHFSLNCHYFSAWGKYVHLFPEPRIH